MEQLSREEQRKRFAALTPEQDTKAITRKEAKEKLTNLSPAERRKLREQLERGELEERETEEEEK